MKSIYLLTFLFLTSYSFAQAKDDNEKINSTEIDIGQHIFGHDYGTTEEQFIEIEGNPDGYLTLSNQRSVMIYGSQVGFIFSNKKLIGVKISNNFIDWMIAKEFKSKSRFYGINWTIKQGLSKRMTKEDLSKKFGRKVTGNLNQRLLAFDDERLLISYMYSRSPGEKLITRINSIYLIPEQMLDKKYVEKSKILKPKKMPSIRLEVQH